MMDADIPDTVVKFVSNLTKAEYDGLVARYTEPDEARYHKRSEAVNEYLAPGVDLRLQRPVNANAKWFTIGEAMVRLQLTIVPVIPLATLSTTSSVQVPLARSPKSVESGSWGLKLPVNGASAPLIELAAESSKTVFV